MDVKIIDGNEIQINIKRKDIIHSRFDNKMLKEFLNIYFRDLDNNHNDMILKLGRKVLREVKPIISEDFSCWVYDELDKVE